MKIGIIASSGGSVFKEAFRILKKYRHQYYVVTDRPCPIESFCKANNIPHRRFETKNIELFGRSAKDYFKEQGGVDFVVLFFTRILSKDLFQIYPTFNIHPSLLPAFKGFSAIQRAQEAGVKFLGATLHLANHLIDNGPILGQITTPIASFQSIRELNKISFVQKLYLFLLLVEIFEKKRIKVTSKCHRIRLSRALFSAAYANPVMNDLYVVKKIKKLQSAEKVLVIP